MAVHETTPVEEHILSVLVENRPGVLSHVVGLFSARGYNIDSLAVGETEDPTVSRITLVSKGDARTMEQIKKQLNKIIDVIKVQDLTEEGFMDRELMLIKVRNAPGLKERLKDMMKEYRFEIVSEDEKVLTVESAESREKTKKLFDFFKKTGILEIAQTGVVALSTKPL